MHKKVIFSLTTFIIILSTITTAATVHSVSVGEQEEKDNPHTTTMEDSSSQEIATHKGGGCISPAWVHDGKNWIPTPVINPVNQKIVLGCLPFNMETRNPIPKPEIIPEGDMSPDITPVNIRWFRL